MKKLFLILFLLFIPNFALANYSLISHTIAGSSNGNDVTTGTIDTTGASLLVVSMGTLSAASACTPSDNKSNTWTTLTDHSGHGGSVRNQLAYVVNPTVGTGHTFTCTQTSSNPSIVVMAWSGAATVSPFDVENGNDGVGLVTIQTGSITPGQDNELVVSGLTWTSGAISSVSVDSSMTIQDQAVSSGTSTGRAFADIVQTTAGAINPTWSGDGAGHSYATSIASFKIPSIGGPNTGSLMLTGVGK